MNEQLSNKIQEKINAGEIKSLPRWRFSLLRYVFWLLGIASIIFGSISVGVIIFLFNDHIKRGVTTVPHEITELLLALPFVWIAFFILFIIVARICINHTKQGYKYSLSRVLLVSIFLSVIFGSIINIIGVGKIIHELLEEVPIYKYVAYDSRRVWDRPTLGRLAGVVSSIQDNNNFSIIDFNDRLWQVKLEFPVKNSFEPEMRSIVQMRGVLEPTSNVFNAHSIKEWGE